MRERDRAFLLATVFLWFGVAACRYATNTATLPPPPLPPSSVSLPAGSTLALINADPIDSNHSKAGDVFAAVVGSDLHATPADTPLLPSGSPARLTLQGSGSNWELALSSVMINGDSFMVNSKNNDGVPSAILGEILGAVPGTKRGKAEQPSGSNNSRVAVRGSRIWVPNGTLLTFRLDQEIQLEGTPRPRS